MSKWFSGPPPSIGWWPASLRRTTDLYRWWNGRYWSTCAYSVDTAKDAGCLAKIQTAEGPVYWRDRPSNWPKRSRT